MAITQINLVNAQEVQIPVSGPAPANHLFIYSGTANFQLQGTGKAWHREKLSFELGRAFTRSQYRKGIGTASLAIISNDHKAINAGWAVDRSG